MRIEKSSAALFALLLLCMLLVAAFVWQRNVDSDAHRYQQHLLSRIDQLDTALDEDVQRILALRLTHYDTLVDTVEQLRRMREAIEAGDGLRGSLDADFDQQLDEYLAVNTEKLELLERLKSQVALLRNALQYLPGVIEHYVAQVDSEERRLGASLLSALMEFNLFPNAERRAQLQGLMARLGEGMDGPSARLLQNILFHVRANIHVRTTINDLAERYEAQPSKAAILELHARFASEYEAQSRQAYDNSLALFIFSLLLLSGLGYAIQRLRGAQHGAEQAWERMHDALESLSEAFALFDADDRLVMWNAQYAEFLALDSGVLREGMAFEELLDRLLAQGHYACEPGHRALLKAELLSVHRRALPAQLETLSDGRRYLVSHNRTSEGGTASVRVDISDRISMEERLLKLSRAVEQSPATVIITDADGTIEYVNQKFVEVTGYSAEEALGNNPRMLKSDSKLPEEYEELWETILSGAEWRGEFQNQRKNGETFWEQASISGIRDSDGRITHFLSVKEDITERKKAEEQLRIAATVYDTTSEAIMVTDRDNLIKAVNPSFTRITGYSPEEVIGKQPSILASGRHDKAFYQKIWDALLHSGHWEGEIWNRDKQGRVYPEWLSLATIRDPEGKVIEHVALFSDITRRKRDEEQIRWQANYDPVTELPNRTLFSDRLESATINAHREGWTSALLFIDLDHFKVVNDSLGHAVGDELLQQVAIRLKACVRETDTVARLGGDEFTIILQDIGGATDAALVAEKIIQRLSGAFNLEGGEVFIGASIGITLYPDDAEDAAVLIRNADMAMYQAKAAGRNDFRFFTQNMNEQMLERMRLENDMRHALERDEFFLEYQPIVDHRDGRVARAEALVRWNHPQQGRMGPDRFIPLAEEGGLIAPLGLWVLEEACRQALEWQQQGLECGVSVNISSRQLKTGLSPRAIDELLRSIGLPAQLLTLEITESLLLEGSEEAIEWMNAVKALGVKLSVDDFGTGFSSLSYLKRFPVDSIKIDKSFVQDLTSDADDAALTRAIIGLAESFNLEVVAEGVEDAQQLAFLQQHDCHLIQGYYFSRPLSAGAFMEYHREVA